MTKRILTAITWALVCGMSVAHASTINSESFSIVGQAFGGQTQSITLDFSYLEPGTQTAFLELDVFGDYDTVGETLMVRVPGRTDPTVAGIAGTTMDGYLNGYNSFSKGPGKIGFTQQFALGDVTSALEPDGQLTLEFVRSAAVGGGSDAQLSGFVTTVTSPTVATTPEPSSMVLVSLGLVCAACYRLRRRRVDHVSETPDSAN